MDIEFKNVTELYNRVYPALKSKVRELHKNKITYIKEPDIWNCLINLRWKMQRGLELSEIVDDILNIDNKILDDYVKGEIKKIKKEANLDVEII